MTPEEFYWSEQKLNPAELFNIRVKSIVWVLECYSKGSIRKKTIQSLLSESDLLSILRTLEESERYEDCVYIKKLIDTIYYEE